MWSSFPDVIGKLGLREIQAVDDSNSMGLLPDSKYTDESSTSCDKSSASLIMG
jgi:hypothetical protein